MSCTGGVLLVSEGKGRLFRRKDEKYLIYLPVNFAEDSMFPFPLESESEVHVKVSFELGNDYLLVERWNEKLEKAVQIERVH
jgi:hypothetical protein